MVYAPAFAELDAEREVVLEEIAMYEDTPQELVHDLFSEAVFGEHPLGRPVIGTAEVISSVEPRRDRGVPRRDVRRRATSSSPPPGTSSTSSCSSCSSRVVPDGAARGTAPVARRSSSPPPPPGFRFQRKDTEQYHVCVGAPGISRSDRRRFAASLLDAILGGSASSRLFQEIREKRGMAYAVYSFASQYTDTGLIGVYVGTREENLATCFEIVAEQLGDIAAGQRPRRRARAREGEPQGPDHALDGVDLEPDEPARAVADHRHGAADVRADHRGDRRGRAGDGRRARRGCCSRPSALSVAGIGPSEERFREAVERIDPAPRRRSRRREPAPRVPGDEESRFRDELGTAPCVAVG